MSREVDGEAEGWLWLLKCKTKIIRTPYPAPAARRVAGCSQPWGTMVAWVCLNRISIELNANSYELFFFEFNFPDIYIGRRRQMNTIAIKPNIMKYNATKSLYLFVWSSLLINHQSLRHLFPASQLPVGGRMAANRGGFGGLD